MARTVLRGPGRSDAFRLPDNDAIAARERARSAGQAFPTAAVLSKTLVTEAKKASERHRLGEVSAVVLQQSLPDAEAAYRNFFASLKGARKGAGQRSRPHA